MKILKVYNNNIVRCINNKGEEYILTGPGVGFKKHSGDYVDDTKVEQRFFAETKTKAKIERLLERIEPQYFELSEYILQEAKKRLNISLNLSLIIPFTDHLVAAIDRAKSGISLPNLSLMEIKTIWKKEFEFSLWIISYIEEKMHINMSIDEAGYIAVYFVNDTGEPRANKSMEIVQIVTDIVNIIEKCFRIRLDKTSSSYIRLVTHLRFFIGRIIGSEVSRDDDNEVLYQYLLERNPNLKTCINYISQYIKNELNYDVTKSELVYLMIHLTQILGK